jgi:hypothetical protein
MRMSTPRSPMHKHTVGAARVLDHSRAATTRSPVNNRAPTRRSERSGLSRRSPGEPRRSRLFCMPAPGLGVYRRRLRTGSVRSDCCPSRAIGKDRCCVGPFRLALQKEPPDVCPVSRIGPPCGNPHRAGLTGRPLAGVPSDLGCSRLWFGKRDAPAARGTAARP